jgi:hypothetical protein
MPQTASHPPDTHAKAKLLRKYARYRNQARCAHALVLFNVIGIPLSHGVNLEYHFTTAFPTTSLTLIVLIIALQLLCIFAMPFPVGYFYHKRGQRSGWGVLFITAALLASCAQLLCHWTQTYILAMILQGPILGLALGTVYTLSTLVLSSHYRHNLPLVSMQSVSIGFLGAITYTLIAKYGVRTRGVANFASAGILLVTLLLARILFRRAKEEQNEPWTKMPQLDIRLPRNISSIYKEDGTIFFLIGYILVFFGIFTFPLYTILILSQTPALYDLSIGSWVLVATLATAAISAPLTASPWFRKHIGPVDTFVASAIFSGAVSIIPAWMPVTFYLCVLAGALYGIGLGAILALHMKVWTCFHWSTASWHPDMGARAGIVSGVAGLSACVGLLVGAIVLEGMENGVRVGSVVSAVCLVGGGVFVAVGRWRRVRGFRVAV